MNAPTRRDKGIAGALFAALLIVLVLAGRTQGNTRDEGYYFDAAELYYGWYGELGENLARFHPERSFTRANVDRWFGYNHEHPALMKTLFGFSWRIFHQCHCPRDGGRHPVAYPRRHVTLGLLSEQEAMRLPTNIAVAAMAALLYLWAAAAWSRTAGVVAALLGVMAPRLFFDAELAAFDAPIAALWVATVYAYWRALADPRWRLRTGVIYGLALGTKLNSFFIPFALGLHFLWVAYRQRRLPPVGALVAMAVVGPLVFFACWPWLWFDTVARLGEYAAFHLHHVYYNMEYLGHNYNKPPFPLSFPYVMMLFTLPVTTLALAVGGGVALVRRWRYEAAHDQPARSERYGTGFLIAVNALCPMAVITFTRAPIFGATKHFHATIPFLALLAGYGVHALAESLGPERRRWTLAIAAAACLPAVLETWRSHPYALSHYNLLAGGPAGGADLGMNRQFWGYSTRGLLPYINEHAAPGEPIYWHDTNQAQLNMDVREGLLRPDLRNTGLEEPGVRASDMAMVIHEKHFNKYEYWIWDFYGTARPSVVLDDEGVPLVTLYERPQKTK
jgi:hypothetical protein